MKMLTFKRFYYFTMNARLPVPAPCEPRAKPKKRNSYLLPQMLNNSSIIPYENALATKGVPCSVSKPLFSKEGLTERFDRFKLHQAIATQYQI